MHTQVRKQQHPTKQAGAAVSVVFCMAKAIYASTIQHILSAIQKKDHNHHGMMMIQCAHKQTINNMSKEEEATDSTTTTVIVARHGERLDYYLRDFKEANFLAIPSTTRPWDPPLTNRGRLHGRKLGEKIKEVLNDLNRQTVNGSIEIVNDGEGGGRGSNKDVKIAPLGIVYSSPMMRCVQTASEAIKGYNHDQHEHDEEANDIEGLKVRIEPGLMESMNEKWFRSWCLPESNGTWGGPKGHTYKDGNFPPPAKSVTDIHEKAKEPCFQLLSSGSEIHQHLVELGELEQQASWMDDSISNISKENFTLKDSSELVKYVQIEEENVYAKELCHYCWQSFESRTQVDTRVEETIELLAQKHPNQTILVLSHGSPCTKLYERLTGDDWETHGICTYACFSIYQRSSKAKGKWEATVINNSSHVKELERKLLIEAKKVRNKIET